VSNSTPQNLKPTTISKLNTVLQCFLIVGAAARAAGLVPPVLEPDSVEVLWNALVLTTGVTTLWSWAVRNVQGGGGARMGGCGGLGAAHSLPALLSGHGGVDIGWWVWRAGLFQPLHQRQPQLAEELGTAFDDSGRSGRAIGRHAEAEAPQGNR
jgi:hypothetical protein